MERIQKVQCDIMEEEVKNHHSKSESIGMLYVWFLYNMMNQEYPFTIGLPLTPKTYALTYILDQIHQSLTNEEKKCPNLLRLFNYSTKNIENIEMMKKHMNILKNLKPL